MYVTNFQYFSALMCLMLMGFTLGLTVSTYFK